MVPYVGTVLINKNNSNKRIKNMALINHQWNETNFILTEHIQSLGQFFGSSFSIKLPKTKNDTNELKI